VSLVRRIAAIVAAFVAAIVYVWVAAVRATPAIKRKKAAARRRPPHETGASASQ
jgi:hypothetical protein